MEENFLSMLGDVPKDESPFKARHRIHQGWWRTAALLRKPGPHPTDRSRSICSTVNDEEARDHLNFLTEEALRSVHDAIESRRTAMCSGMIQQPRIWENLLSSQPLCFNFWGYLKYHKPLAGSFFKGLLKDFGQIVDIRFEWAPQPRQAFTGDNSAFDVIVEYVTSGNKSEMLGLECKYVDDLTSKEYDYASYRTTYESSRERFLQDYGFYRRREFNQLFRSQLIAYAYERKTGVKIRCGLFCSQLDAGALKTARDFQAALSGGDSDFLILTHEEFIERIQKMETDWSTREWTMMLWARYAGLKLSERAYDTYRSSLP